MSTKRRHHVRTSTSPSEFKFQMSYFLESLSKVRWLKIMALCMYITLVLFKLFTIPTQKLTTKNMEDVENQHHPSSDLGTSIHNVILDISNHVSWFLGGNQPSTTSYEQDKDGPKSISSSTNHSSVSHSSISEEQSSHEKAQLHNKTPKKRILALHGTKSNNQVTKMQLQNLNITDEVYDIVFLNGPIPEEEADPNLQDFVRGPFYSWIDNRKESIKQREMHDSLRSAIQELLSFIEEHGPFDGLYGFSSGAFIITMAIATLIDPRIRCKLLLENNDDGGIIDIIPSRQQYGRQEGGVGTYFGKKSLSVRTSVRSKAGILEESHGHENTIFSSLFNTNNNLQSPPRKNIQDSEEELGLDKIPFKFVIFACSSGFDNIYSNLTDFFKAMEIVTPDFSNTLCPGGGTAGGIPSFHIIGTEDSRKGKSEEIACLFSKRTIIYQPGGHYISKNLQEDLELQSSIKDFISNYGNLPPTSTTPIQIPQSMTSTSELSSFALLPESQVAIVQLNSYILDSKSNTILAALKAQRPSKPFMYNARVQNPSNFTSYGDVVDFIERGHGDLRRLRIKDGDVVAYCTPPGGSATATLAFLSIASQSTAVPLAPNLTKADALDALDQFEANHLILFEGIDCKGVREAFKEYAFVSTQDVIIHWAEMKNDERPGMFQFIYSEEQIMSFDPSSTPYLRLPENGISLLLRTSGTTARPKGVPLKQGDLVKNGEILASSMGLKESDICYSIMPLYHIGGISASIMSTLVTGGALCCDGSVFTPNQMIDALALTRPQPTWYSSVPTIHNATVNFLTNVASSNEKYSAFGISPNGVWKEGHSLRMIRSGAAALLPSDARALSRAYGDIPIRPTYSMSEQMPITQPPLGMAKVLSEKPGTVGVPVTSSLAIVNAVTLRPLPPGVPGVVAISGPTMMDRYLNNPDADRMSFFHLTLKGLEGSENSYQIREDHKFFLTGDVGMIDRDGFLSLTGRAKEMIKKGGEQISPFEVEEVLMHHPFVQTAVCFSVPSKLYGEEVGCALVLTNKSKPEENGRDEKDLISKLRSFLKGTETSIAKELLAPFKWPTHWKFVLDDDLPKTKTKKYIRIGKVFEPCIPVHTGPLLPPLTHHYYVLLQTFHRLGGKNGNDI